MNFIDTILSYLAPYECLGCNVEGSLLCARCIQQIDPLPSACHACGRPASRSRTCPECRRSSHIRSLRACVDYGGVTKELVKQLKFTGAQAAAQLMATQMTQQLDKSQGGILVPVPTATTRVRQRGYDQAHLLTKAISRQTSLPMARLLARHGQTRQVGASRDQRKIQLAQAFDVMRPSLAKDAHIILIDDVATTGATLEMAAMSLNAVGAARVDALVFARALVATSNI